MSDPDELLRDVAESWPVTESAEVYRGDWVVGLRADVLHRPGHPEDTFERVVLEDPGAVIVLAVDEEERAVVLRQYRHPVGMRLVELPAGKLDEVGEDPLDAARRELREEVVLEAGEWRHLLTTYASPGITQERHVLYLARDLREVPRDFHPHHEEADMTVHRVPVADLVEAILDGRVADGPVVIAVLAYQALRARGTV